MECTLVKDCGKDEDTESRTCKRDAGWLAGRFRSFSNCLKRQMSAGQWPAVEASTFDRSPGISMGMGTSMILKGQPPRPTAASAILVASQCTAYSNTKPF
jgi:hypothetical protein